MKSLPERRALLGWLAGLAVVVHLLALYWPVSPSGPAEIPGLDKLVHAALFAVPVWLLGRLTGRVWLVAGVFAVHAVVSELVQASFLPFRDGDVFDAAADLAGIALAVLVLKRTNRR